MSPRIMALPVPLQCLVITFLLVLVAVTLTVPDASASELAAAAERLTDRKLKVRAAAINQIIETEDEASLALLRGLLEARVYYRKADKRLVFARKDGSSFDTVDVFSGESLGKARKRALKKVGINNRIRRALRAAIARAELVDRDVAVRLQAIATLAKGSGAENIKMLRERLPAETDEGARRAIESVLALADVRSEDSAVRTAAITRLGESTEIQSGNTLKQLVEAPPDSFTAADTRLAKEALRQFEMRATFYGWIETLFFGLSLGSVLALAAIGLAITFGVMGVINMAHGELMMLGAYTTYVVQTAFPNWIGASLLIAIPAAFLVSALFGVLIERGVIRFLYGRPLETLLATFGISLILQQLVRTVFSPLNRAVQTPEWMSGSLEVNAMLSLTYNRLYIVVFTILVFLALMWVMKRTALGLQVRAVAQNRRMARALGVRSARVDMMTFALGSGIAGVAGVALSQLTNVGPNLGQAYIVDSFLVVVFGGVGNLWGTLVSGLSLGVANKLMEPWAGAVLAKVIVLVAIILFIQRNPRGLFPQRGRAAEE